MILRDFDVETDLTMVSDWWASHDWPPMPADILPSCGRVVEDNGVGLCAGWLYIAECMGWIGWPISNPAEAPHKRGRAMEVLIEDLECIGETAGLKCLMTVTPVISLSELYRKRGWLCGGTQSLELIKRIGG